MKEILTAQPHRLGQRYPGGGRGHKLEETPGQMWWASEVCSGCGAEGILFPHLVLFFHSCCSLENPAFQFPELILISWDWLVLSDPYPCLSPWLHEFIPALWLTQPTLTHSPRSHTHSNSCDSTL